MRKAAAEGRAYARVGDGDGGDPFADVEHRDELARALAPCRARSARRSRCGSAPLTVPEIAKVLGEPLTTVEGRVYRALRKLREALG